MKPGIEFRNVTKRYGHGADAPMAVKGISFEVTKGSLTTILGPSGCGKTTTLRLIAGLESPTSGQIMIEGRDVTTLGPASRNVSLVFQSYALFPHMDVLTNVAYGLRMAGSGETTAHQRARETLKGVGLAGFDRRLPSELSGGQQQRVALARALVLQPAVLLFDEPLSNLDARLRREMRDEIRSLQQRMALTVAYVTHDQSEALAVSDQIIVMDQGVIAQRGSPQDLYERPQSEFVAGFMGEAMLFSGTAADDGTVALGPLRVSPRRFRAAAEGDASAYAGAGAGAGAGDGARAAGDATLPGPVKVAVRPEAWQIRRNGGGLAARLIKSAYLGSFYEYTFETELGNLFVVSSDLTDVLPTGAQVRLELAEHGVSVVPSGARQG